MEFFQTKNNIFCVLEHLPFDILISSKTNEIFCCDSFHGISIIYATKLCNNWISLERCFAKENLLFRWHKLRWHFIRWVAITIDDFREWEKTRNQIEYSFWKRVWIWNELRNWATFFIRKFKRFAACNCETIGMRLIFFRSRFLLRKNWI